MFTIEHLWIVKWGKGSKIMGAVEHSCWNCANIYKLVRRYFASSVSLNQPALLARFLFACFDEFLFVFYGTYRQSQILYGYDLWKTFPNVQDAPILIHIPFVRYSRLLCSIRSTKYWGGKNSAKHAFPGNIGGGFSGKILIFKKEWLLWGRSIWLTSHWILLHGEIHDVLLKMCSALHL